tara:strand:+ start:10604 stop:10978 length:375 start_codon:yes stop_codon:yes gene_type:complete
MSSTQIKKRIKAGVKRAQEKTGFLKTYVVEMQTKTADGQGGFTVSWSTFATIKGFVFPATTKDKIVDDRIKSEDIKKFEFEYVGGIDSSMRIFYDGKYYNISPPKSVADSDIWVVIVGFLGDAT